MIECVPNFSAGRAPEVVERLARRIEGTPGVALLDRHQDVDHNRAVLTFAGSPRAVLEAALGAVETAAELIDLRRHSGAHPRIGATDVLPFVPLEGATLEECVEVAHQAGEEIWRRLRIPVYFYEAAALRPERRRLERIRKLGFETLAVRSAEPELRPDVGGPELHPTAGAVMVGARKFLIAWNVYLKNNNVAAARRLAKRIRESSGGLAHVKALGLALESRGRAQVSINLTDFEATPMHRVWEALQQAAQEEGVELGESEIVGLIPRRALMDAGRHLLGLPPEVLEATVEGRLEQKLPEAQG